MIIGLLAAPGSGFQNSGSQKEYILQGVNNKNIHTKTHQNNFGLVKKIYKKKLKMVNGGI